MSGEVIQNIPHTDFTLTIFYCKSVYTVRACEGCWKADMLRRKGKTTLARSDCMTEHWHAVTGRSFWSDRQSKTAHAKSDFMTEWLVAMILICRTGKARQLQHTQCV